MDLPLQDFGAALLIGVLIGIDRERKKEADDTSDIAGLRTFILLALAGAISAWLAQQVSPWIFVAMGIVVGGQIIFGYFAFTRTNPSYGITTEIAATVVFLLGGCAVFGYRELALGMAVIMSAALAYKPALHGMVAKLRPDDIHAGVKLLIASFIVLPLLPDQTIDPWGAINPNRIWWLVILISGMSLVGYVATRWLGTHHGNALTGFFGGLVSSTAVTLTFTKRSMDESPQQQQDTTVAKSLAAGVLLAWSIMFVRVMVVVAVIYRPLLWQLVGPLLAMGALTAAAALWYWYHSRRSARDEEEEMPLKNPFRLWPAIQFAALFTLVELVVKLVKTYFSEQGFYGVAAVAGLTDVDAITLAMAQYASEEGDARIAVTSIVIAIISNTLVKCGFVLVWGSRPMARRVGLVTVAMVATGMGALWLI